MRNERSRVFIDFHSLEHALLQLQFSAPVKGVHCGNRVKNALVALENECCIDMYPVVNQLPKRSTT